MSQILRSWSVDVDVHVDVHVDSILLLDVFTDNILLYVNVLFSVNIDTNALLKCFVNNKRILDSITATLWMSTSLSTRAPHHGLHRSCIQQGTVNLLGQFDEECNFEFQYSSFEFNKPQALSNSKSTKTTFLDRNSNRLYSKTHPFPLPLAIEIPFQAFERNDCSYHFLIPSPNLFYSPWWIP